MEYLKKIFNEYLNSEGEVLIGEIMFDRDRILRELERDGYTEAFNSWLNERKQEMLSKADELLTLYDNASRFRTLQRIFKRGVITPFIGAGLSMSSGYPGWTNFLFKIRSETRVSETEFVQLIADGKFDTAAQKLFDDMPSGSFLETIENEFGCSLELYGPVQKIPFLFNTSVITTNFDNVIERCYKNAEVDFDEILLGNNAKELPRFLGEGKNVLIKLHGKANSSDGRILTEDEYDTHYTIENTLDSVIETISNKTLLFLGCSLYVDRTLSSLSSILAQKGIGNIPKHYAFLSLGNSEDRLKRRDQLADCNIFPIWYPNDEDHNECIEALLTKLEEGD